ncbi:MAG: VOC family protein [Armatimonadetes bacterium]|nr:VOC family protein [Armatimonadota bacterium]
MPVNPLPEGTQPLVPYLIVKDAAKAIDFYKKVFAAEEVARMPCPESKKIMHAELRIAGCMLYLADEQPEAGFKSPRTLGGSPVGMTLYCLDADKVFQRAVSAGAKVLKPMADAFWGDRYGTVTDPFGHQWTVMMRKEELTMEQVMQRSKTAMAAHA